MGHYDELHYALAQKQRREKEERETRWKATRIPNIVLSDLELIFDDLDYFREEIAHIRAIIKILLKGY